jgi:hypothetical protein
VAENIFGTSIEGIDVGYIDFYSGEFYEKSFSILELNNAKNELENIGKIISTNL